MTAPQSLAIRCRGLTKHFGEVAAVDGFHLDVWEGSVVSLLGPSGCGKTTALRLIAGFEEPEAGTVEIGGREVAGPHGWVPPERRQVGMVFQDHALFPHLDVAGNVGFGLPDGDPARVAEVLDLVGLGDLSQRMPADLSGGQQQRVALARAMAPNPRVVLLDEPFSSLDAALREHVRAEVRQILAVAGATAVLVTHDQEEALSFSDVVAVMRAGSTVQVAPPTTLYLEPADEWIAGFVGDADFIEAPVQDGLATTALGEFPADGPDRVGARVMLRPESVVLEADETGKGVVTDRRFFGHDQLVTVRLDDGSRVRSRFGPTPVLAEGTRVAVRAESARVF